MPKTKNKKLRMVRGVIIAGIQDNLLGSLTHKIANLYEIDDDHMWFEFGDLKNEIVKVDVSGHIRDMIERR